MHFLSDLSNLECNTTLAFKMMDGVRSSVSRHLTFFGYLSLCGPDLINSHLTRVNITPDFFFPKQMMEHRWLENSKRLCMYGYSTHVHVQLSYLFTRVKFLNL